MEKVIIRVDENGISTFLTHNKVGKEVEKELNRFSLKIKGKGVLAPTKDKAKKCFLILRKHGYNIL